MRTSVLTLACCVLAPWALARADEPALPKPGPEHEEFKRLVGEWDVTVNVTGEKETKGTAVYKMGFGGFWLTEDFTGDFGGMKFEGRGTTGYDPLKKKYVSTWIDSMDPQMMVMEGTYDKDKHTLTETGEGPGPDGKPTKYRNVIEYKDNDSFVFTMYAAKDGKDQQVMTLTYKRKK